MRPSYQISCALCCFAALAAADCSFGADARILELIPQIVAAEARYGNIDVRYTRKYEKPSAVHSQDPASWTSTYHVVAQEILRRDDRTYEAQMAGGGAAQASLSQSMFDGVDARFLHIQDGKKTGSILMNHKGEIGNRFHPHRILEFSGMNVPLSIRLQGYDDYPIEPRVVRERGQMVTKIVPIKFPSVQWIGEEEVRGLRCIMVALTNIHETRKIPATRIEFWLAKDRNWLPIRRAYFHLPYSDSIATSEAMADDMRELAPGVWFPFHAVETVFNPDVIKSEKRQELRYKLETTVESVSLEPQYPLEFFRDLAFPDGTAVREVDHGVETRKYVVGQTENETANTQRPFDAAPAAESPAWSARVPWKKVVPGLLAAIIIAYAIRAGRRQTTTAK